MGGWESYVDTLTASAPVKKAAIYDLQGTLCAATAGFALRDEEFENVYKLFVNPADAFVDGITANGVKYMALRAEADKLYGRKGSDGIVIARTAKTFVIGVHDEAASTSDAAVVVEGFADKLRASGY